MNKFKIGEKVYFFPVKGVLKGLGPYKVYFAKIIDIGELDSSEAGFTSSSLGGILKLDIKYNDGDSVLRFHKSVYQTKEEAIQRELEDSFENILYVRGFADSTPTDENKKMLVGVGNGQMQNIKSLLDMYYTPKIYKTADFKL